jgi:hypothetical protein
MVTMCSFTEVSDELIQKDAIFCLFDSSSSNCFPSNLIWRDATFTFLCTIVGKALSQPISTYIHSKGCISHYVENLYKFHSNLSEKTLLLCNLIDLLRCSSEHTGILIDDFFNSNGSKLISSCLKRYYSFTLHTLNIIISKFSF